MSPESLLAGRFVPLDPFQHGPLPGMVGMAVPGLVPALEADIARIRVKAEGRRLSQIELERLLEHLLNPELAADLPALESELQGCLGGDRRWSLTRLRQAVLDLGSGETLNRLAFDTEIDLEPLRRLLPAYETALQEAAATPSKHRRPKVHLDPAAAVARFESGRDQGLPLDSLFEDLEEAFGLEPGSTQEGDAARVEPVGGVVPGFRTWVETYSWERATEGAPVPDEESSLLEELTRFLEGNPSQAFDIRELTGGHILGFLLPHPDAHEVRRLRRALDPFLRWAAREQEAPLERFLDPGQELAKRLDSLLAANAELAATGGKATSRAVVSGINPVRVHAADGEQARVVAIPAAAAACIQAGDLLLGKWKQGTFELAAILPAEAMPARKKES